MIPSLLACALLSAAALQGNELPGGLRVYEKEELVYSLSWWILGAGEAALTLDPTASYGPRPSLHLTYIVKSGGLAGKFFKVNDRIDSYLDPTTGCSMAIEKRLQEGKRVEDRLVEFDYASGRAKTTKYETASGSIRNPVDITTTAISGCLNDILAALYAIRSHAPLVPGSSFEVPTFDRGEAYSMTVQVLKKESISIRLGRFDTFVVEPQPRFGGAFQKKGKLRIWLQDAPARLPVLIKSEAAVGSVKAELKRIVRTGPVM
ncbi:MAG: DUF3108 domain-containing protein [Acidobacteria bacterium]|nr:DUF3108 domain-containing protein [Acidobacteriota bacterium]